MSDSDFVDVGDELVVRIAGYPVGKAKVVSIYGEEVRVRVDDPEGDEYFFVSLPLDFKDYDITDGVAHEESPRWKDEAERLRLEQQYLDGMGE